MYAGGSIRLKSKNQLKLEGTAGITMFSSQSISMYGKSKLGLRSDGVLALQGKTSSWSGGGSLNLSAGVINLNGAATQPVSPVTTMTGYSLPNTVFETGAGWVSQNGTLPTIVTRAPTHEPYAGHNSGVNSTTDLSANAASSVASTSNVTIAPTTRQAQAQAAYARISTRAVQNPISADNYVAEPTSTATVPVTQSGQ